MSDHRESLAQVNLHCSILFFAIEYEHVELGSILGLERTNDLGIEWLQNADRFRRQKQDMDIVLLHLFVRGCIVGQEDQMLAFFFCPKIEGHHVIFELQTGHPRSFVECVVHVSRPIGIPIFKASGIFTDCKRLQDLCLSGWHEFHFCRHVLCVAWVTDADSP